MARINGELRAALLQLSEYHPIHHGNLGQTYSIDLNEWLVRDDGRKSRPGKADLLGYTQAVITIAIHSQRTALYEKAGFMTVRLHVNRNGITQFIVFDDDVRLS